MLNVSDAFKQAIASGAEQRICIPLASGYFITRDEIETTGGITLEEVSCSDENLSIGAAVQSHLTFSMISPGAMDDILADTLEFPVYLGVRTGSFALSGETVPQGAEFCMVCNRGLSTQFTVYGSTQWNYLLTDIQSVAIKEPAYGLVLYEGHIYAYSASGTLVGSFITEPDRSDLRASDSIPLANAFMQEKFADWAHENRCVYWSEQEETVYHLNSGIPSGDLFEVIPLGWFTASRPTALQGQLINIDAYDRMGKFDKDAADFVASIQTPCTLQTLFEQLCIFVEVDASDAELLNGEMLYKGDVDLSECTCRELLSYIAEASCGFARMNRNGQCEITWYTQQEYTISKDMRFSLEVSCSQVPQVGSLRVQSTENDVGVTVKGAAALPDFRLNVSDGSLYLMTTEVSGYDIIGNPFLTADSESEILPYAQAIFARLNAIGSYTPVTVDCMGNPASECGDIITVVADDDSEKSFPVMAQTLNLLGRARITYEATGTTEYRLTSPADRQEIRSGRRVFELTKSIDGLRSAMEEKVGMDELAKYATIEQTIDQIKAEVGAIEVGATNLLRDSGIEQQISAQSSISYTLNEECVADENYTMRIWTDGTGGSYSLYCSDNKLCDLADNQDGTYSATFVWPSGVQSDAATVKNDSENAATLEKVKLEAGTLATDWSPCAGEVRNSAVSITPDGIELNSTGSIKVDGGTVNIRSGASLAMEAATDEDATINGGAIWHGKNMVISTSEPSSPKLGMIWIKPALSSAVAVASNVATYASSVYYSGSWTANALTESQFRGSNAIKCTGTAQGAAPSGSYICTYTVKIHMWHNGTAGARSVHVCLSNTSGGTDVDCGTQTFYESGWFEATVYSGVWLGNSSTIYINLTKDVEDFAVSAGKPFSVSASLSGSTDSGSSSETPTPVSGWTSCEVYYYAGGD